MAKNRLQELAIAQAANNPNVTFRPGGARGATETRFNQISSSGGGTPDKPAPGVTFTSGPTASGVRPGTTQQPAPAPTSFGPRRPSTVSPTSFVPIASSFIRPNLELSFIEERSATPQEVRTFIKAQDQAQARRAGATTSAAAFLPPSTATPQGRIEEKQPEGLGTRTRRSVQQFRQGFGEGRDVMSAFAFSGGQRTVTGPEGRPLGQRLRNEAGGSELVGFSAGFIGQTALFSNYISLVRGAGAPIVQAAGRVPGGSFLASSGIKLAAAEPIVREGIRTQRATRTPEQRRAFAAAGPGATGETFTRTDFLIGQTGRQFAIPGTDRNISLGIRPAAFQISPILDAGAGRVAARQTAQARGLSQEQASLFVSGFEQERIGRGATEAVAFVGTESLSELFGGIRTQAALNRLPSTATRGRRALIGGLAIAGEGASEGAIQTRVQQRTREQPLNLAEIGTGGALGGGFSGLIGGTVVGFGDRPIGKLAGFGGNLADFPFEQAGDLLGSGLASSGIRRIPTPTPSVSFQSILPQFDSGSPRRSVQRGGQRPNVPSFTGSLTPTFEPNIGIPPITESPSSRRGPSVPSFTPSFTPTSAPTSTSTPNDTVTNTLTQTFIGTPTPTSTSTPTFINTLSPQLRAPPPLLPFFPALGGGARRGGFKTRRRRFVNEIEQAGQIFNDVLSFGRTTNRRVKKVPKRKGKRKKRR